MDALRHKFARPRLVRWPGRSSHVQMRPIPDALIARAEENARTRFGLQGAPSKGVQFEVERGIQIVSASTGIEADELRAECVPLEIALLLHAWSRVQFEGDHETEALQTFLRKRVNDEQTIHLDGCAAYNSGSPAEFYGRPLEELTRGQILYCHLVGSAYGEWFGPGVTKKPTREWLNKN